MDESLKSTVFLKDRRIFLLRKFSSQNKVLKSFIEFKLGLVICLKFDANIK